MSNSILAFLVLSIPAASVLADNPKRPTKPPALLDVASSAFANNQSIPSEYTCDGAETAPPLSWSKVPAATKSVAILVDDPDAPKGTFTHWLVTGISPTTSSITGALPVGAVAANNDKGSSGYAGPCPPSGRHHYRFQVYALDVALPAAMTRATFSSAVKGHVVASGTLVGTYQKQSR